jgi:hypothetical protein
MRTQLGRQNQPDDAKAASLPDQVADLHGLVLAIAAEVCYLAT